MANLRLAAWKSWRKFHPCLVTLGIRHAAREKDAQIEELNKQLKELEKTVNSLKEKK